MATEEADLAVIGAGFHGLMTAATYLRLNPTSRIVVVDAADSIGGVWAKERLYPGVKSNHLFGFYEYPSYPMEKVTGPSPSQYVPGQMVHDYLDKFAKQSGVAARTRLRTRVENVTKRGEVGADAEGWELQLRGIDSNSKDGGKVSILHAKKLVIATGLTSTPFMPSLPGSANFNAPLFHVKDFYNQRELLSTVKNIAVLGGSKSAYDIAYAFATKSANPDVQVHMIIRKSGHGPALMAPPYVTPFKIWIEKLAMTRLLSWMSPCAWADADGYAYIRQLLHGTAIGQFLVDKFFGILADDVNTLNGVDKHPETAKLKPWNSPFWTATFIGIFNFETDFMELVRSGKVKVHVADIDHLSSHAVHLSDGTALNDLDALVCSTGWKYVPPVPFTNISAAALGLPHASPTPAPYASRADTAILFKFPRLANPPTTNITPSPASPNDINAPPLLNQPYRLYRFMIPPSFATKKDRTLAFAGITSNLPTATTAELQALWISAWFAGDIEPDASEEEIEYEATLHSRFGKWRSPLGHGANYPDFVFDVIPYFDMLLEQLGLQRWRKGGQNTMPTRSAAHMDSYFSWLKWPQWREWVVPYTLADYRGVVDEYEELMKKGNRGVNGVKG